MKKLLIVTVLFATTSMAIAGDLAKSEVSKAVQQATPLKVLDVEDSPLHGVYQVITENGTIYATKDGKHLISGVIHKLEPGLKNLTQERNEQLFKLKIDQLKNDFITFPAPKQKYEVIVFYAADCGYCHKMHSEIAGYNARGITVHYAAWPRDGLYSQDRLNKSQGHQALENIWCSENQNLAFNLASRRQQLPESSCKNTIEQQFNLGSLMGVSGTPAVYSMKGTQVTRGYAPPEALLSQLNGMAL